MRRFFTSPIAWLSYISLAWFIVVWGAFVRHSKSGDGCGEHWPLCEGQLVPTVADSAMWIEYLHRATSGVFGVLILIAFLLSKKKLPAASALFFTTTEALIGAVLVLSGVVKEDATPEKALYLGIHLLNTLLLFISLVWCYLDSRGLEVKKPSKANLGILLLFSLVAAFGVIASLSGNIDTGFDILADFKADSHWTVKLRIFHLLLGAILTLLIIYRRISFSAAPVEIQIISGVGAFFLKDQISWKLLHLGTSSALWLILATSILTLQFDENREDSAKLPKP